MFEKLYLDKAVLDGMMSFLLPPSPFVHRHRPSPFRFAWFACIGHAPSITPSFQNPSLLSLCTRVSPQAPWHRHGGAPRVSSPPEPSGNSHIISHSPARSRKVQDQWSKRSLFFTEDLDPYIILYCYNRNSS